MTGRGREHPAQLATPAQSDSAATILVTGASGFVGREVCRQLLTEGYAVRGLVRPESARRLCHGVEPCEARDLSDLTAIRAAVKGCAGVVHLAARVHVLRETSMDPLQSFRRVNVEGTVNVMLAAQEACASRLVFVSSIAACERHPTPYGRSKREAEEALAKHASTGPTSVVILRPPGVYGPGMPGNIPRLLTQVRRGFPIPVPRTENQRSFIFVGNLAAAIRTALEYDKGGVHTFAVADSTPLSTQRFAEYIGAAVGRQPRLIRIPVRAMRLLGRVGDLIAVLLGWSPLTSVTVDRMFGSLVVDTQDATSMLGFRPPTSTEDAVAATVPHYSRTTRK